MVDMRLMYCFPPAGGAAGLFRSWADHLPADVEVRLVRYRPGQLAGGPAGSVQELAAGACQDVLAQHRTAAGFFGHSLGALVAFECVRILQQAGERRPAALCVAGHVAPHLPSPGPDLHRLRSEEFWNEVALLGGADPGLLANSDVRAAVEPRVRAEFRAAETYRFERGWPLDCDVLALAGSADRRAPAGDMAAWRMHTTGGFDLTVVPGGHFFPATSPEQTLRRVRKGLEAVSSAG
jgi:surfactin synthase thioesterase subunit